MKATLNEKRVTFWGPWKLFPESISIIQASRSEEVVSSLTFRHVGQYKTCLDYTSTSTSMIFDVSRK